MLHALPVREANVAKEGSEMKAALYLFLSYFHLKPFPWDGFAAADTTADAAPY